MPLIAHNNLKGYDRLRQEGHHVLTPDRAQKQDIREMHIGLLNMMQDSALLPTEWQFLRLIGDSNQIAQFYVHPFSLKELKRSKETQSYIDENYDTFEDLKKCGLDGLIITGANIENPNLEDNDFWEPLQEVMDWAWNNVTSTITACLATHAIMQFRYGIKRTALPKKKVGVYQSRVRDRSHPLVKGMNTVFDVPHSRNNQITWDQFEEAKMKILVNSHEGGVHMATSADGFRLVCFQGHQEYDTISILKEYKRDFGLYLNGQIESPPFLPYHYFPSEALPILQKYHADTRVNPKALFPEDEITPLIENTWRDSGRSIIGNWVGRVYQTTHVDRQKQYMDGIDPNNPLGL